MTSSPTVLLVDDQQSFRFLLHQQLQDSGFAAVTAQSVEEGLLLLQQQPIELILSDLVMPGTDGLAFLAIARERFPTLPFVVITSHGSITTAVEALKLGAFDYIEKHCSQDELQITVRRALQYHRLARENEQFRQQLQQEHCFQNIVTSSPAMKNALELAASVARSPRTLVALLGESGCGKEVLARAIHFSGSGMPSNFVGVNCAAIPETLLESELFGHVRGAFTGADRDRDGKVAQAKGGTLLLDEIGDMPLAMQAKLLRTLEDRVFTRVGSNQLVPVDCRVVVATNRNLSRLVEDGRFREDLYHRVNVFPIAIPPLRERREDIALLVEHFMTLLRDQLGKTLAGISRGAMSKLAEYHWPGNVRELRNCLERAAILVPQEELIRPEHLSICASVAPGSQAMEAGQVHYALSLPQDALSLEAITQQVLDITLERCGGNKSKAAALLQVNRKMFYR